VFFAPFAVKIAFFQKKPSKNFFLPKIPINFAAQSTFNFALNNEQRIGRHKSHTRDDGKII
jgi:hypothetical protein